MTKEKVLSILMRSEGFISGEGMSQTIGVSRMAISAAVKALREEGYEIESVTRKGYRLINRPDLLNKGELLAHMDPKRLETVVCLDSVDSTNHYLAGLALQGSPQGTIVISNEQTRGKGKKLSSFSSLKNKGIYLSMLLRPEEGQDLYVEDLKDLPLKAAECVCRAIEKVIHVTPEIRPINDIYVEGKKVCGILTEIASENESGIVYYGILGIGIYVHQDVNDFSEEEKKVKSSLDIVTGTTISRAGLCAALIEEMDRLWK